MVPVHEWRASYVRVHQIGSLLPRYQPLATIGGAATGGAATGGATGEARRSRGGGGPAGGAPST